MSVNYGTSEHLSRGRFVDGAISMSLIPRVCRLVSTLSPHNWPQPNIGCDSRTVATPAASRSVHGRYEY